MPRSDRWSPEDSRERYRHRHGQRDHSRSDNRRTYKQGFSRERSTIGRNRRGERGRSRERYMLSRDRYRRRAGPREWPDRSTRRKRSRSREGCVISQRGSRRENTTNQHGDLLRNRGREPSHPYEFGERNSTHSHPQSQNTVNASKILNNVRARVVRTHSLPMYLGPSHQGERTISNSAVLFQTHVSRILATAEGGIFALPQDREVKSVWRAQPDAFISKRRELLSDLLADYLPTHCQLTTCQPVVVYRISGQRETMQVQQVTITDWLRLLVREEGLDWGAKEAALEALDAIAARPDEPRLSVTARLVSAFRTTVVDPDRPHATETAFFWRSSGRTMEQLLQHGRGIQYRGVQSVGTVNRNSPPSSLTLPRADGTPDYPKLRALTEGTRWKRLTQGTYQAALLLGRQPLRTDITVINSGHTIQCGTASEYAPTCL